MRLGAVTRVALLSSCLAIGMLLSVGNGGARAAEAAGKPVKVAYQEVIRSLFYAPSYIAIGKGFFRDEGLDVDLKTAQGSDKATAALLAGAADIVLAGPETAVYIRNGQSPMKTKIFCALTATDGSYLVGREKVANFDWASLKGKQVMSWRKGSSPALFLEQILRNHGLDPDKDVTVINNTAIPARLGAFMAGTADYGTFFEPDVSRIEMEGKGYALANVGNSLGQIDYTVFLATDGFIAKNPKAVQGWTNAIYRARRWLDETDPTEAAKVLAPFFPGLSDELLAATIVRHRESKLWKATPLVGPENISALQDLLISGGILKESERVKYEDVVAPEFARNAIAAAK
jgi:NitT/TauT family transport system substrate-binding protein